MKTSRKVISVIMALMMLVSVFAMFSYAAAPESAIDLYITPDKDSYAPGETATFTVSIKTEKVVGDILGGGTFPVAYDSSALSRLSDEQTPLSVHGVEGLFPTYNSALGGATFKEACIASGDTLDARNNWDSIIAYTIVDDGQTPYDACSKKMDLFSFKLKITDTAKDGDYVIGFNIGSFENYNGVINVTNADLGSVTYFPEESGFGLPSNYTFHDATVRVGAPAPAGPAVSKAKSQVKMTATSKTTVADEFSFRVISKISDSDWDTYFKNTGVEGAKTDYITAVGMVAYKGAAAFDAETAKRVVAGESVADYTAATTDYISKVSDTADAEFGAIIKANHSTLNNDVTYMGFVQYVDASGNSQTIFYETAGTAALSTNYNNIVSAYLARYPFAA